jgi:Helix-turn-helix domain
MVIAQDHAVFAVAFTVADEPGPGLTGRAGMSLRQIVGWLGRAPSTISRELGRSSAGGVAAGWQKNGDRHVRRCRLWSKRRVIC